MKPSRRLHKALMSAILLILLVAVTASAATIHTVQSGDTLWNIAQRYQTQVDLIRSLNNLEGSTIYPGQRLVIAEPGDSIHTVQPGETYWSISQRYGTSARELMATNDAAHAILLTGQVLVIPGPKQAPPEDSLEDALAAYTAGHTEITFGIAVLDLTSGEMVSVGGQTPLPAASTIKLPIALLAYQQVAAGERSLDERIVYQASRHHTGGSGAIRFFVSEGQEFTLGHLLKQMLTISDNVAWRMVDQHLGRATISAYLKDLGGTTVYPDGRNLTTADDMVHYLAALAAFAREHPEQGAVLLSDLRYPMWVDGLREGVPLPVPVAHKAGTLSRMAGDVGLVGGTRPYAIAVLSDGWHSVDDGFSAIAAITAIVHDFQRQRPPAPPGVNPFAAVSR